MCVDCILTRMLQLLKYRVKYANRFMPNKKKKSPVLEMDCLWVPFWGIPKIKFWNYCKSAFYPWPTRSESAKMQLDVAT